MERGNIKRLFFPNRRIGGESRNVDSRKKWKNLEKRVADLEVRVQNQPKEIVEMLMKNFDNQYL